MSISAGFSEVDMTPPPGTHKIGWLMDVVGDVVHDPIFARIAVLESDGQWLVFVQLDTLSIRWTQTDEIRREVQARLGIPGERVMVAATHNHAGPAVANCGLVKRDDRYVAEMVRRIVAGVVQAAQNRQEAELGFGSCFQFGLSHNRRVIMRDGTVRTHGRFDEPNALCFEGPIDPEVAVLAARDKGGRLLGAIVNFACHPTHHGPDNGFSAGYPGVVAATMKTLGCPVTLFLSGACGNIHTSDPSAGGADKSMEEVGRRLAEDAMGAIEGMSYRGTARLRARSRTIELPYRDPTEEEIRGTVRGAQRFVDPGIYDRMIPDLVRRIEERGAQPAEVQVHFVDEIAFVGVPAEYFVELGLRIKEGAYPLHALIVGHANGMVGYLPHREAFQRGGYETTFIQSSRMAPGAGELVAECAVDLIREELGDTE
ncbi:MAG: hypothetical protein JXQ73_33570 [Phycisphaerae bacterium]|nr:hypothetical protein [Phycisphaerae bacterium]